MLVNFYFPEWLCSLKSFDVEGVPPNKGDFVYVRNELMAKSGELDYNAWKNPWQVDRVDFGVRVYPGGGESYYSADAHLLPADKFAKELSELVATKKISPEVAGLAYKIIANSGLPPYYTLHGTQICFAWFENDNKLYAHVCPTGVEWKFYGNVTWMTATDASLSPMVLDVIKIFEV
jgi:hypothetical protein